MTFLFLRHLLFLGPIDVPVVRSAVFSLAHRFLVIFLVTIHYDIHVIVVSSNIRAALTLIEAWESLIRSNYFILIQVLLGSLENHCLKLTSLWATLRWSALKIFNVKWILGQIIPKITWCLAIFLIKTLTPVLDQRTIPKAVARKIN